MKVATVNKSYEEAIRKRIADDALPIEICPVECFPSCNEYCEHRNCIAIWTWIPERVYEFDKIIGDIVMSQRELAGAASIEIFDPVLISTPQEIAKMILEATEIERSWACAKAC